MNALINYLNEKLYTDKPIEIDENTEFSVFSKKYPNDLKGDFQIFKIYNNNPFCLNFLHFIYRIYQNCKSNTTGYIEANAVYYILNTVEKIQFNRNYIDFLRNNIFLVIYQGIPHKYDLDSSEDKFMISVLNQFKELKDSSNKSNIIVENQSTQEDQNIVDYFMSKGIRNVNIRDSNGKTALMYAAMNRQVEIVENLLRVDNINVNDKDNSGKTALMYAAINCQVKIVNDFLNVESINVNIQDNSGKTALMYAANNCQVEIVKNLLRVDNINVNIQDNSYKTALFFAVEEKIDTTLFENQLNTVTELSKKNDIDPNIIVGSCYLSNLNVSIWSDTTVLSYAVYYGCHPNTENVFSEQYYKITEILLKIRTIDVNKGTLKPLISATCFRNHEKYALLLLNHFNIDPNVTYFDYTTPLMYAILNKKANVVEKLFNKFLLNRNQIFSVQQSKDSHLQISSNIIHDMTPKLDINKHNAFGQTAKWFAEHLEGDDEAVYHIQYLFNHYEKNRGQESKDNLI